MDRREFIKTAGLGLLGFAVLSFVGNLPEPKEQLRQVMPDQTLEPLNTRIIPDKTDGELFAERTREIINSAEIVVDEWQYIDCTNDRAEAMLDSITDYGHDVRIEWYGEFTV